MGDARMLREIFLRSGQSAVRRAARAETLFRRLRDDDGPSPKANPWRAPRPTEARSVDESEADADALADASTAVASK